MRTVICTVLLFVCLSAHAQQQLMIPPALTGLTFDLEIQNGTQTFYGSTQTPTFGINSGWMAPTIIVNKGDSITLNVTNNLTVTTTIHWHGLHVSPMNDGGPHLIIEPTATWSPSFIVRNSASTFWYHPHGAHQTEQQIGKGLAGLFIVRDSAEAALTLPRIYGVDDIPLIVQSKVFDDLSQIAIANDMDTALFVNGTINPYFDAPAQVIRFRFLNASSLRTFNFGFSKSIPFYQIATDGGLLDTPVAITRLLLSPGERAEILINFSGMTNDTLYLMSFGSEMPTGVYGADTVGFGDDEIHDYEDNYLNGADYNLMRINVVTPTLSPVATIPASLVPYTPFNPLSATTHRTFAFDTIRLLPMDKPNRAEGPFGINNSVFDMDVVNEVVFLNTTETWTLHNRTLVAHPFHIHDIQFNVVEKGRPLMPSERGWKDVVLVLPGDSVTFVTKFETFADPITPYMYHCHLLHHEDDGMMGSFLVIDTTATGIKDVAKGDILVFPNPASDHISIQFPDNIHSGDIAIVNVLGETVLSTRVGNTNTSTLNIDHLSSGIYFLHIRSTNTLFTNKILKQ